MATASHPPTEPLAVGTWAEDGEFDSKSERYLARRLAAASADYKGVALTTFLLGAGVATAAGPTRWQLGAELLAGGAGGGGVRGAAGAVALAQAWAALPLADGSQRLRIGLGGLAGSGGGGARPVASATWQVAFGQVGP